MEYFVNKNMNEIHRDTTEHGIETNWDAMNIAIE